MRYDPITKLLHWGIALAITLQMLNSLVMEAPEPGEVRSAIEAGLFEIHEYTGLLAFILLLLRWWWSVSGHAAGGWRHLFPWYFADGRKELLADIRREVPDWFRGRIPEPSESDAIAKTVHGLGLILASIMAASGLVIFFGMQENGAMNPVVHWVSEIHEEVSTLMWIFLGGHAGMAFWHQALGHNVLGKMFLSLRR